MRELSALRYILSAIIVAVGSRAHSRGCKLSFEESCSIRFQFREMGVRLLADQISERLGSVVMCDVRCAGTLS